MLIVLDTGGFEVFYGGGGHVRGLHCRMSSCLSHQRLKIRGGDEGGGGKRGGIK